MTDPIFVEISDCSVERVGSDAPISRAAVLEKAVIAGGSLVVGGVVIGGLPALATSAQSAGHDVEILNFALLIEYLQASFYEEALARGALTGELREFTRVVGAHERAHLAYIKRTLGRKARAKPSLDFSDTTRDADKFGRTAVTIEEIGLAAYNGQAANLTKEALTAAATIVSVEARHASWIRGIVGRNPAPHATDAGSSAAKVTAAVKRTGFVKS
jgi:rubrerythrin